jgi:RNA polymerase sigma factor (TIGR02999 family)
MAHRLEGERGEVAADAQRVLDGVFLAAYHELRRLAAAVRRSFPALTLTPTMLVHDAWVKLSATPEVAALPSLHFKRIAARAMRQVLVELARGRRAAKRNAVFVTIDTDETSSPSTPSELIALDAALDELARIDPSHAQMVVYRFFGGLTVAETAELLGVSEETIYRDWRLARAWLAARMRDGEWRNQGEHTVASSPGAV